ncbi:MAG: succinyl-diaminopimelate desuccinylase [Myxococcota bacterium]
MPDATFDNAIEFARELIRIPSLPGDEGTLAKRLAGEMTALGFEGVASDDLGSVYGVIRGGGDAPAVMLSCHLDMVAVGDESEWEVPPLEGAVKDGYLHGRGAMDIKGPLALQTYVAASMAGSASGDIIVAHTVLEERGGWGMQHLVESGAVEPAAVIIGESTQGDIRGRDSWGRVARFCTRAR